MKKLHCIDDKGFFLKDVWIGKGMLITDLAQLLIPNPDLENEIRDSEGIVVKAAVILEPITNPLYINPEEYPIPAGLHLPRFDWEIKKWTEGRVWTTEELQSKRRNLIESIGTVRREQLQVEFNYNGHRQSYNDYDQRMADKCKLLFSKDNFIGDSSKWADSSQPSLCWTGKDYDGSEYILLVTSADFFEGMEETWIIREQTARVFEPVIESEINSLASLVEIESYEILTRFKEMLGEV